MAGLFAPAIRSTRCRLIGPVTQTIRGDSSRTHAATVSSEALALSVATVAPCAAAAQSTYNRRGSRGPRDKTRSPVWRCIRSCMYSPMRRTFRKNLQPGIDCHSPRAKCRMTTREDPARSARRYRSPSVCVPLEVRPNRSSRSTCGAGGRGAFVTPTKFTLYLSTCPATIFGFRCDNQTDCCMTASPSTSAPFCHCGGLSRARLEETSLNVLSENWHAHPFSAPAVLARRARARLRAVLPTPGQLVDAYASVVRHRAFAAILKHETEARDTCHLPEPDGLQVARPDRF
jgi:hypothetical protein